MKPLGSKPIMGICDFAHYIAEKHRNRSDTHSIQQMAVVHTHKQILGLASGLSLHFLTIAPPSVAKKVWANLKNLPWLFRRNNWGSVGVRGRIHALESPISPCAFVPGGEKGRQGDLFEATLCQFPGDQEKVCAPVHLSKAVQESAGNLWHVGC